MSGVLTCVEPRPATAAPELGELAGLAFDEVVHRYDGHISRVLRARVRDTDLAETLTQECFVRAWRGRHGFRGEASLAAWLRRIAERVAIDEARSVRAAFWRRLSRSADASAIAALADPGPSPERLLIARERLRAVRRRLGRLPRQQRLVFELRFGHEMRLEEIATSMGIEVGTVKSHLARAIGAIRRSLSTREIEPDAGAREGRVSA